MSVSAVNQECPELVSMGRDREVRSPLVRKLALRKLSRLEQGQFRLEDDWGSHLIGHHTCELNIPEVRVHADRFYRQLISGGALGAAESYLDEEWDCEDLTGLLRIFARNLCAQKVTGSRLGFLSQSITRFTHWMARNTPSRSRKNIEAHYDLGNEFFSLFLDPTMMYSSAIFEADDISLEQAQLSRLDQICRKLELRDSDHLLEVGTGWGGLAIHAAQNFGCRVTTTTISENQYRFVLQKVQAAGLEDQIKVIKQDYRDLTGRFDKLVSIEMIEAVGHQFYDTYFRQMGNLLIDGGKMLLQAIVIPEQRYSDYLKSVDFIQKYIFPGGSLPSLTALQASVSRTSKLRMLEVKDFAEDYARTLQEWRIRFWDKIEEVRSLGYSERFIRMWHYYLCYCEAGFRERSVGVVHAVWGK